MFKSKEMLCGLTEKTGCDDARTLSSILFRGLTPADFFNILPQLTPLYCLEILMNDIVADRGLYCQREIGALHDQTH
jgi:hypothetical protein